MSAAIVRFTPIYGSGHGDSDMLCYLLEVDECKILLDCGWNYDFRVEDLQQLAEYECLDVFRVAPSIDAVLVSHSDLAHIGALPYAFSQLGLSCKVYSTSPVFKMGQMFMYDAFLSRNAQEAFTLFSLDDVDTTFEDFVPLKYLQRYALTGRGQGISIIPYAAGRTLGGCIWKITKDTEEIVYAVDYNNRKERHLNATRLPELVRPSVLITDSHNVLMAQEKRTKRDQQLIQEISNTLARDGNVLIPSDSAGRSLELLVLLDEYWTRQNVHYPLVFLSHTSYNAIEFAKGQLEWMSDSVVKQFEQSRENPFNLRTVMMCHSLSELESLPSPSVVIASLPSVQGGFSLELFREWAVLPNTSVIFTERPKPGTLAHELLSIEPRQRPYNISVEVKEKVPLEGEELDAYHKRQKEEVKETERQKQREKLEEKLEVDMELEDLETIDQLARNPFQLTYDLTVEQFRAMKLPVMFPFEDVPREHDDFGEAVEVALYTRDENPEKKEEEKAKQDVMDLDEEEVPTKTIVSNPVIPVVCSFSYIDFEGRTDGRSIKTILQNVAPRKLVLVHGPPEASDALAEHITSQMSSICSVVRAPVPGERVDLTSDTNVYQIKMRDSLFETVHFRQLGEYEVAWVDGQLEINEDSPMLVPLAAGALLPSHEVAFFGDVKLSQFKAVLEHNGFRTQIGGGLLVANESIGVRKNANGELELEGALNEDYFRVRELLYGQMEMV